MSPARKVPWSEALSPREVEVFRRTFHLVNDILLGVKGTEPRFRGTILSQGLAGYLKVPFRKSIHFPLSPESLKKMQQTERVLLARRHRSDPVFRLLRRWARAERAPMQYEQWVFEGEELYRQPERVQHRELLACRQRLMRSVKGLVALAVHNRTVQEFVTLASMGHEESFLRLVELDKIFLTAEFARDWMRWGQGSEDQEFFRQLSRSLVRDTYRNHKASARLGIACYLAWFLGSERLTKRQLFEFLRAQGITGYRDFEDFRRIVNRLGLKRYQEGQEGH